MDGGEDLTTDTSRTVAAIQIRFVFLFTSRYLTHIRASTYGSIAPIFLPWQPSGPGNSFQPRITNQLFPLKHGKDQTCTTAHPIPPACGPRPSGSQADWSVFWDVVTSFAPHRRRKAVVIKGLAEPHFTLFPGCPATAPHETHQELPPRQWLKKKRQLVGIEAWKTSFLASSLGLGGFHLSSYHPQLDGGLLPTSEDDWAPQEEAMLTTRGPPPSSILLPA